MRRFLILFIGLIMLGGMWRAPAPVSATTTQGRISFVKGPPEASTPDKNAGQHQPLIQANYPPRRLPQTSSPASPIGFWLGWLLLLLCSWLWLRKEVANE